MSYFNQFPYVNYQFPDDVIRLYKNIGIRPAIVENIIRTQSNFELYTIQDGETPETLAFDFYGDVNLHWTIMLANNILNLYTDWPKPSGQFEEYLFHKYKGERDSELEFTREGVQEFLDFTGSPDNNYRGMVEGTVIRPHHFESSTGIEFSYDTIVNGPTNNAFGNTAGIDNRTNVTPVSWYEYEERLNEGKRNIKILKQIVVERLQEELRDLTHG